jgi:acetyl esterase/lipase
MSLTSRVFCYISGKNDRARDAGLQTPDDVFRFDNIPYGKVKKWQQLDVYRPKKKGEGTAFSRLPVIISVHGGGWVYGTKEVYQFYCMSLAQRGFAVVNFNYRLAPEYKFPASIQDTDRVFAWVRENADKYGFDPNHIFAVGDSAGGHMLVLYTIMCNSDEYARLLGFEPSKERQAPAAVALNCAVFRIDFGEKGNPHLRKLMCGLLPHKGTPEEQEMINPLPFMNDMFPPAFIMNANADKLVMMEQTESFTAKLDEFRVDHTVKVYGTQEKPLDHVFHCNIRTKEAARCNDDECAFFREHM